MLLFDMSNLVFTNILQYHTSTGDQPDMHVTRNLVIGALGRIRTKLRKWDDPTVLCFDGRKYWRRDEFEHYKSSRKKDRDSGKFDWDAFFPQYDQLKVELKENFPVVCMDIESAEADDTIAVLATAFSQMTDVCIVSSDKDFIQLQQMVSPTIKQWSIYHKKFITVKNTQYDLLEHILRGDSSDGIPNIRSDDDVFVSPDKKQRPIRADWVKKCQAFGRAQPEKYCKTFQEMKNFARNEKLIDLTKIPEDLKKEILDTYNNTTPAKSKVFDYCVKNRLTRVLKEGGF